MRADVYKTAVLAGTLGLFIGAGAASAKTLYASHPLLHRALRQLQAAQTALQKATHDCGGHRQTALAKVAAALAETQVAVAYADAHPQEDAGQGH